MPLLLSKTYEIVTEESAENGEAEERGWAWEACEHSVREAARLIRGLAPSQSPITDPARCWFTQYDEMGDICTGERENTSIHFSHENKPHALRYWIVAIRAAGFKIHGD